MAGDASYNSVALLLHGDGANGSTTFTDSSPTPLTVSGFGNAQISTAQSQFGGASIALDGTGDYLSATSSLFATGTGNFTVEGWIRRTTATFGAIFTSILSVNTGVGVILYVDSTTGYPVIAVGNGVAADSVTGTTAVPTGAWHHIAAVRNGSTITVYVDGTSCGSTTTTKSLERTLAHIGKLYTDSASNYLNGYLDDVRFTAGVARYTANFTPPASAFPNSVVLDTISGNVKDDGGANCARTVYVYRRDTGALVASTVSDSGTGNYSITTTYGGAHTLVFLDDVAGTPHNALVLDQVFGV